MEVKTIVLFLAGMLVIVIGSAFIASGVSKPKNLDISELVGEARWQLGKTDAEVTIVEFSDFQCPACKTSALEVKEILKRYDGEIRLIYRHFPLTLNHENALMAAIASEVAGDQGKFWDMHDMLFEKQTEWANEKNVVDIFSGYARELEIDEEHFKTSIKDNKYEKRVRDDMNTGSNINIRETPSFFVNGVKVPVRELGTEISRLLLEK